MVRRGNPLWVLRASNQLAAATADSWQMRGLARSWYKHTQRRSVQCLEFLFSIWNCNLFKLETYSTSILHFHLDHEGSRGAGADLFSEVTTDRSWGKSMNLCQGIFRLDIRKRFYTQRVVEYWTGSPGKWSCISRTEFKNSAPWCDFWPVLCRVRSQTQ